MTIQTLVVNFVPAANPKEKFKESNWMRAEEGFRLSKCRCSIQPGHEEWGTRAVIRDDNFFSWDLVIILLILLVMQLLRRHLLYIIGCT
jgi:hypothetical protein